MAKLTGIGIYKLLPKTNCGECKFPTCMAFAMQVAAKKVALEACPYVSDAAKQELADSAAPPMRVVTIGAGPGAVAIGGETVLFRHEEKFHRPAAVAVRVSDQSDVAAEVDAVGRLKFIRSGKQVGVEMIALEQKGDAKSFRAAAEVVRDRTELAVVLMSTDPAAMAGALEVLAERKPLLYGATTSNFDETVRLAKDHKVPLAVRGKSLEELADLTARAKQAGVEDLVLAPELGNTGDALSVLTQLGVSRSRRTSARSAIPSSRSPPPRTRSRRACRGRCTCASTHPSWSCAAGKRGRSCPSSRRDSTSSPTRRCRTPSKRSWSSCASPVRILRCW